MQPCSLHLSKSKHHEHTPARSLENRRPEVFQQLLLINTDYFSVPPFFPTVLWERFCDLRWKNVLFSLQTKEVSECRAKATLRRLKVSHSHYSILYPTALPFHTPFSASTHSPASTVVAGTFDAIFYTFTSALYLLQLVLLKPVSVCHLENTEAKQNENELTRIL